MANENILKRLHIYMRTYNQYFLKSQFNQDVERDREGGEWEGQLHIFSDMEFSLFQPNNAVKTTMQI